MRSLPMVVRRLALVAIACVPVCWTVLGIAGWNWFERANPERAATVRAIGPAALLLPWTASRDESPAAVFSTALVSSGDDVHGFSWWVLGADDDDGPGTVVNLDEGSSSLRALRHEARGPLFWFRLEGEEYVVRDAAWVAEAESAQRPLTEIGRRMGELGGRQGRLGGRQGRIGGRLGALSARLATLQTRLALAGQADDPDTRARIESLRLDLAELRRQQEPLAEQMSALGEQMSRLGREMNDARQQAERTLRALAERAIREGKAEQLHAEA